MSIETSLSLRDGLLCNVDMDNLCIEATDELLEMAHEKPPPLEDSVTSSTSSTSSSIDPGVIGKDPWCTLSSYGGASALNEMELKELIGPNEEGGLVWTAQLVSAGTSIKPRRGMPFPVYAYDFLSSVKRIGTPSVEVHAGAGYDDLWDPYSRQESRELKPEEARWVFKGVLNGWPGLTLMEVRKVRVEDHGNNLLKKMMSTATGKRKIWDCHRDGNERGVDLVDAINATKVNRDTVITVEMR